MESLGFQSVLDFGVFKIFRLGMLNMYFLIIFEEILFNKLCIIFLFILYRDEDMQSLVSLMSMKQVDIGNLDDFEEDNEDDDENRVN